LYDSPLQGERTATRAVPAVDGKEDKGVCSVRIFSFRFLLLFPLQLVDYQCCHKRATLGFQDLSFEALKGQLLQCERSAFASPNVNFRFAVNIFYGFQLATGRMKSLRCSTSNKHDKDYSLPFYFFTFLPLSVCFDKELDEVRVHRVYGT